MAGEILIGRSPEGNQTLSLKRANRHGLIAGATGTGKTVTLQVLAEQFAAAGVPVFAADVKGDLSGIAVAGDPPPKWAAERAKQIELGDFTPRAAPVVFWDLYGQQGHPVRTTATEFGPLLFSRILECSEAQEGAITIAFKMADDWVAQGKAEGLLLNLKDLRALLTYIAENAEAIGKTYGLVSPTTIAALQRKLLQMEMDGAEPFFGERALELFDFIRTTPDGRGVVNVLAADRLVQSPTLYATFLLWLMSELWEELPEAGDLDKPKLVFFFDEAHLLFRDAPKALLARIEQVVRLIRSKGVGIYFITQSPSDVPDPVLAQLGNRVQHALRAYTPADQKAVRAAAASFRANPGVDVAKEIQELNVGEALVSVLDEKGAPTPVARTLVRPPASRVGPVTVAERNSAITASPMAIKYGQMVDRQSAHEILTARAAQAAELAAAQAERAAWEKEQAKAAKAAPKPAREAAPRGRARVSTTERVVKQVGGRVASNAANTIVRELIRGIFGTVKRR